MKHHGLEEINVPIGGLFVTDKPAIIYTLLGSCVSVTMFDPIRKIAGLNHIVLPGTFVENDYEKMLDEKDSRYGIFSIEKLLYDMEALGSERKNIEAKIFGGSLMGREGRSVLNVQESNVDFVKAFLTMARIKVIEEVVLQQEALKIYLNSSTGEVKVVKVKGNGK